MIIHNLEQNSPEWFEIRLGKPTASKFNALITPTGKPSAQIVPYARYLAAELYAGESLDKFKGNKHTDRGHEFEPEARAWYEFMYDCTVDEVGFVTDDAGSYGCSPDGLIGAHGGLEIKCLEAPKHLKVIEADEADKDFINQVKGSIFVCDRDWWDILFYHPKLPKKVFRIYRDKEYNEKLSNAINDVLSQRDEALVKLKAMG